MSRRAVRNLIVSLAVVLGFLAIGLVGHQPLYVVDGLGLLAVVSIEPVAALRARWTR